MTRKIYQWHRKLSIVIAIPVLLWAVSGFMHPLMTNLRPAIASQGIPAAVLDTSRIKIPLQQALLQNHLAHFSNFRLVHIDTNWFYQVQLSDPTVAGNAKAINAPLYLSCTNGKILPAGDWLYAQYIAREFLEGGSAMPRSAGDGIAHVASMNESAHDRHEEDCCGAATSFVLNGPAGTKVTNVSQLTAFDNEYKSINRLLPVYRVSFDRPDGIRIYVETTQDRFSFAMDNRRAIFDEIFRLFHLWGWLDFLGKGRLVVEICFALTAFFTSLLGIYIFFATRAAKKVSGRRIHRMIAITASLFTLLWTFSGSYHAFAKFTDDTRDRFFVKETFSSDSLRFDLPRLQAAVKSPLANISLVRMNGQCYWQVYSSPITVRKDLMKDAAAPIAPVTYVHIQDYTIPNQGEARYAAWMATKFSGHPASSILSVTPVTHFGDEYNFTDKRLPVWRVAYPANHRERYYVETATGRLASRVDDRDLPEGYSFSLLHKHHFMDWGGKQVRDGSTLFWAFIQVIMVLTGLLLYFKYRKRIAGR